MQQSSAHDCVERAAVYTLAGYPLDAARSSWQYRAVMTAHVAQVAITNEAVWCTDRYGRCRHLATSAAHFHTLKAENNTVSESSDWPSSEFSLVSHVFAYVNGCWIPTAGCRRDHWQWQLSSLDTGRTALAFIHHSSQLKPTQRG